MATIIEDNALVLFQGDSITDAGRNRDDGDDLSVKGYANMAAAMFSAMYPEKNVKFLNRGYSGDRVCDLRRRWDRDCIDLKPDWVSILIGINDCWRRYDRNMPMTAEQYEEDYRYILTETKKRSDARIILCEPFLLPVEDKLHWREDLDPKIQVVRKLAREFHAIYIPLDGIFARVSAQRNAAFWASDGVHPAAPGQAVIARAWLDATSR